MTDTDKNQRRFRVAVCGAITIAFCGTSALIGKLPQDLLGVIVSFATGLIVTPVLASLIEWLVHHYIFHSEFPILRNVSSVHRTHHKFPRARFVITMLPKTGFWNRKPFLLKERVESGLTYVVQLLFYMTIGLTFIGIPAWLFSGKKSYVIGISIATVVFSNLFIVFHDAIHRPEDHRFIKRISWFADARDRHEIHHMNGGVNLNTIVPLADVILGTRFRPRAADAVYLK